MMLLAAAILLVARAAALPTVVINLDLPPEERWRDYATRSRRAIISRVSSLGAIYEEGVGREAMVRWVKAAPVGDELMAEYRSIVRYVNDSDVTLERMIILDMWHAVQAPLFGCTGLLAAMSDGTVIHGRNVDTDILVVARQGAEHPGKYPGESTFYEGVLERGGKPIASFVGLGSGALGIHTGMRLRDGPNTGWSINSNARVVPNNITLNLLATEAGSQNFPWLLRKFLQDIPDYSGAVEAVASMSVNAPNYFIIGGSGPYQGAVVTKDRGGLREPGTPPPRFLSAEDGIWNLLQTNDDVNKEPLDRRRDIVLARLSGDRQDQVSEEFVLKEMTSFPSMNSDTILTWVANPAAGTHRTIPRPASELAANLADRALHEQMHAPMPHQFPSSVPAAKAARAAQPASASQPSFPHRLRSGQRIAALETDMA